MIDPWCDDPALIDWVSDSPDGERVRQLWHNAGHRLSLDEYDAELWSASDTYREMVAAEGDDYDRAASEEWIATEQRLAELIGHDEACSYTLKASPEEISAHLLAIADGKTAELSSFERSECYAIADAAWAEQTRARIAAERAS